MAAGFIRRYLTDPGLEEISAIEGVVIIDREPPGVIQGLGSGTVTLVAEFENGPFETPIEVFSGGDVASTFGLFGHTYDGVVSNHPCARARKADGQILPEYWNGNGYIALANKKFRRLILVRVDTSVGEVSFSRLASVSGSANFNFDLESGQILAIKLNGGGAVNATFTGVEAVINSAAGTYPSTFTGGEWIDFVIDGTTYRAVFLSTDSTQAQVVARMNLAAGYTAFSVQGGNVTRLTGRQRGTGGSVRILAVSGALVTTATGFTPAASVAGTGNVANIDQVTEAEVKTIVEGAVAGTRVDRDGAGKLRISCSSTPLTGTIEIDATSTADGLGFTESVVATAASGTAGLIPAGTRVKTAGGVEFVTMQDINVTETGAGPYKVKVRHGLDDGTGVSALTATVTTVTAPIAIGSFSVTNDLPIAAALTESAIDAKYLTAIDKTTAVSSVVKETNLIVSARASNAVRGRLRSNAVDASANGCRGRVAVVRPPLNTTRAAAKSTTSQPGIGAYRNQRVIYAYPGAATYIPGIALRGLAGGAGFTSDGIVDVGFDTWVASTCSQLAPEENPGQVTDAMLGIVSIERGNADVQALTMDDYKSFKKSGIAALRIDNGDVIIQSGVTSVDPSTNPNLKNIARRRMADFIQDTLAERLVAFNKKLQSRSRRAQSLGEVDAFLASLESANQPENQRIDSYSIDGKSGNTASSIAAGIFRMIIKVRTLSSMDVIVLDTEVGENVTIQEAA